MNIIIVPQNNKSFYCRPDSTLIRALDDYFIPDYVESIEIAPVLYIKTFRAGKAIAQRFINRYIDSYGYGLLIIPNLKSEYSENREFIANTLDFTSIIPLEKSSLDSYQDASSDNIIYKVNNDSVFTDFKLPTIEDIFSSISKISDFCSLRIGDFICFQRDTPIKISLGDIVSCHKADQQLFNFTIK